MNAEKSPPASEPSTPDPFAPPEESAEEEQSAGTGTGPDDAPRSPDPEEAEPAPKPKPAKAGKKGKRHGARPSKTAAAAPASKPSRLAFWGLVIFVGAVVIGTAVYLMVRRSGKPQWTIGTEVPVELTLVATDKANLACAATEEVAGKRCAFEAPKKPSAQGPKKDEQALLKPYTTTDRRNLLAAGLWSEPALAGALPAGRFNVKCTFVVEGQMKQLAVRWAATGPWNESLQNWFTGTVKNCTLVPAAAAASRASR